MKIKGKKAGSRTPNNSNRTLVNNMKKLTKENSGGVGKTYHEKEGTRSQILTTRSAENGE